MLKISYKSKLSEVTVRLPESNEEVTIILDDVSENSFVVDQDVPGNLKIYIEAINRSGTTWDEQGKVDIHGISFKAYIVISNDDFGKLIHLSSETDDVFKYTVIAGDIDPVAVDGSSGFGWSFRSR